MKEVVFAKESSFRRKLQVLAAPIATAVIAVVPTEPRSSLGFWSWRAGLRSTVVVTNSDGFSHRRNPNAAFAANVEVLFFQIDLVPGRDSHCTGQPSAPIGKSRAVKLDFLISGRFAHRRSSPHLPRQNRHSLLARKQAIFACLAQDFSITALETGELEVPSAHCFVDQKVEWISLDDGLPHLNSDNEALSRYQAVENKS